MASIDHLGLSARDPLASAGALAALLGVGAPSADGPDGDMFRVDVEGAFVSFIASSSPVAGHVAFSVSARRFADLVARLAARGAPFGNDPEDPQNGRTDDPQGGAGRVYWVSDDGHLFEAIARAPAGAGAAQVPGADAEHPNLVLVRRYLAAIEANAPAEVLRTFFTDDVVQRELPNRLVPDGATRDLAALLAANERGRKVVVSQRHDVKNAVASGDHVAMEVEWSAVLRVPVGKLGAGDTMRASFAVFITVRDGRIAAQRNYDCFEPF